FEFIEALSLQFKTTLFLDRRNSQSFEAEPHYQRMLEICERLYGSDHLKTAIALQNLASFYYRRGVEYLREPLLIRALAIREKQLGSEHPETVATLYNLAL